MPFDKFKEGLHRPWHAKFVDGLGIQAKIHYLLAKTIQEQRLREPEVIAEERKNGDFYGLWKMGRDSRAVLRAIETYAREDEAVVRYLRAKDEFVELLRFGVEDVRLLRRGTSTYRDLWMQAPAYGEARALLEASHLESRSEAERHDDLHEALLDLFPHEITVVSVMWNEGRVLMKLPTLEGTEKDPAKTIGFPRDFVLPFHTVEQTHRRQFDGPLQKVLKAVEWGDEARAIWTDSPKVLIARTSSTKYDPSDTYWLWQEENYKYVWVPADILLGYCAGEDTGELVCHLREMCRTYLEHGRKLVGEIADGKYRKMPHKAIITVDDNLSVDEHAKLFLETMNLCL